MAEMPAEAALPVQMKKAGLDPSNVRFVAVSHLHYDHTGSMEAFAGATVVSARGEKLEAINERGLLRYSRSQDWNDVANWVEIDYQAGSPLGTFTAHHDLLGDGSIVLVDLKGHTSGSQGMLVHAPQGPILLTGDAAWVDESWHYAARPIAAGDMDQWWEQIWRIKSLVRLVPDLLVVAGHDLSRVLTAHREDVTVHAGAALDVAATPR
jgi:glyoxylase-like metal-dependent hydrolase (beta-lactamase superfamily II)